MTNDLCVCGPMTRADGFCECGAEESAAEIRWGGCCGDPGEPPMRDVMNMTAAERIAVRVSIDEHGCWRWTGTHSDEGYGVITFRGRFMYAHRLSFETHVGPIPDGLQIDHLCRVRDCINPEHLEPVTRSENSRRIPRVRPTECVRGHSFTEENTQVTPEGHHRCRECRRIAKRAYRARKRAERQQMSLDCNEAVGRATLARPYFDLDGNEGTLAEVYSSQL